MKETKKEGQTEKRERQDTIPRKSRKLREKNMSLLVLSQTKDVKV